MSRYDYTPAAVSQAQRFARERGLAALHADTEPEYAELISAAERDVDVLERLDHNLDDLRSPDEEEDPNPTGDVCGAVARAQGPCEHGLGHPGRHRDAAGNEWEQG